MTFTVLIVGLGEVAMGYDLDRPDGDLVLTHARSFSIHPDFSIVAGVDPDPDRCALFESRYAAQGDADLAAALAQTQPDVVVIASPTSHHRAAVRTILDCAAPKLILCEKPLAYDLSEARAMVDGCRSRGIPLFVNYQRRVDPGVLEVKRRIASGAIAGPVKGVGWYDKGLVHNGSHYLNLLEFWLGPVRGYRVLDAGCQGPGNDVEPDVRIEFDAGTVMLISARGAEFSHHELQLVAPNGCLRYERGGARIAWQPTASDPLVGGYTVLGSDREEIPSGSGRLLWYSADSVATVLNGGRSDLCTGEAALRTLETVLEIKTAL